MDLFLSRVQRIKQGIIIFVALAAANALAVTLVYTFARFSLDRSTREDLISAGKMAALVLENSVKPKEGLTPEASLVKAAPRLEGILKLAPETKRAYLLEKTDEGYAYVADTRGDRLGLQISGPHPVLHPPHGLIEAGKSGLPVVEHVQERSGGKWLTFVPLVGDYTQVEGVLGVESSSESAIRRTETLNEVFSWAIVLAVFLSAALAIFFSIHFLMGEAKVETEERRRFIFRQFAEVGLGACAAYCLLAGGIAQASLMSNRADREDEVAHLAAMQRTQVVISRRLMGDQNAPLFEASGTLSNSRAPWLADALVSTLNDPSTNDEHNKAQLRSLINELDKEAAASSQRLTRQQKQEAQISDRLSQAVAGLLGVVLGSFLLLRLRSRRDQALLKAVRQGRRAQSDLGHIVDNVPVGLFTWGGGDVHFSNPAWRQMLGLPDQGVTGEAALAKIHPNDRSALMAVLEGEPQAESNEIQFRVLCTQSRMRHLALKAVPIAGSGMGDAKVLAFTLDITDSVEVKTSLETKGQEVELKNKMLAAALEDLEANLESVVRCLVRAVEAKDPYTAGHSERVMEYSLWIGEELGLGPYEMRVLELGTLVHDVGKIGIPDAILTKPAGLTNEEFASIKMHPELGVRILEGIGLFQDCMPIVRWHHERLNGSGYPDGLREEDIPFLVRIAAVADVFDAMTSTRAYRAGIEPTLVLKIIRGDVDKGMLDEVVVEALERAVKRKGVIPQGEHFPHLRKAA